MEVNILTVTLYLIVTSQYLKIDRNINFTNWEPGYAFID